MSTILRMLIAPVVMLAVAFGLVLSGLGMIPARAADYPLNVSMTTTGVVTVKNPTLQSFADCKVYYDRNDYPLTLGSPALIEPGYTDTFQLGRPAESGDVIYVQCMQDGPYRTTVGVFTYSAPVDPDPQPQPEIFKTDFRVQRIGIGKIRVTNRSDWTVMARVNSGDVFILAPGERETVKTSAASGNVVIWVEGVEGNNTQVVFSISIRQKAPQGNTPKGKPVHAGPKAKG